MTVYKIRHKETGLWSRGSAPPRWNKVGKVWRNRSALMNHLILHYEYRKGYPKAEMENWDIIEIEVVETPGNTVNVGDYMKARGKW